MAFTFTQVFDGLFLIEPKVFGDERGFFYESYVEKAFFEAGIDAKFVQDNVSKSQKGVFRGLHFQKNHPQSKLIQVLDGKIIDVALDLRKKSSTFLKFYAVELDSTLHKSLFIPKGFAHGFLTLSETATIMYKCDDFYHPEDESGILWCDKTLGLKEYLIEKGFLGAETVPVLSKKDSLLPAMSEICIDASVEPVETIAPIPENGGFENLNHRT